MVSSSSITGKKSSFNKSQIQYFKRVNNLSLKNPKIIGFGISDKKTFNEACKYSNGAIIGTNFIKSLDKNDLSNSIREYIRLLR